MKSSEDKLKFVELRAKGMSFEKISKELDISKPTLIKWNGELYEEVQEAQYYELENLVEQYGLLRSSRFEAYCKVLNLALQELQERAEKKELDTVPTDKLLFLVEQLEKRIEKDTQKELVSVHVAENWSLNSKFLEVG